MKITKIILTLTIILNIHCYAKQNNRNTEVYNDNKQGQQAERKEVKLGIERSQEYLPFLNGCIIEQNMKEQELDWHW